jgi:hypothetical protein
MGRIGFYLLYHTLKIYDTIFGYSYLSISMEHKCNDCAYQTRYKSHLQNHLKRKIQRINRDFCRSIQLQIL